MLIAKFLMWTMTSKDLVYSSSPKCLEPNLPLQIDLQKQNLISPTAHWQLCSSLAYLNTAAEYTFLYKQIYILYIYLDIFVLQLHQVKYLLLIEELTCNWNFVCRSWLGFVLIPMCICVWVIDWSDKTNKPLSLMTVPLHSASHFFLLVILLH